MVLLYELNLLTQGEYNEQNHSQSQARPPAIQQQLDQSQSASKPENDMGRVEGLPR